MSSYFSTELQVNNYLGLGGEVDSLQLPLVVYALIIWLNRLVMLSSQGKFLLEENSFLLKKKIENWCGVSSLGGQGRRPREVKAVQSRVWCPSSAHALLRAHRIKRCFTG